MDFLTLWKDADPDIPIFIAAKSEYSKLRTSSSQKEAMPRFSTLVLPK